jgi:hypothetical protein
MISTGHSLPICGSIRISGVQRSFLGCRVWLRGTPITQLQHSVDLIALRDLCEGHINLDCVFILPEPAQQEELERLALQWSPDEVVWIPRRKAAKAMGMSKFKMSDFALDEQMFLLKLWWD